MTSEGHFRIGAPFEAVGDRHWMPSKGDTLLLAEYGGREIVAFEIKATGAPGREGARHLTWLRDQLGERFLAGIVFHTGPRVFAMGERIMAVTICAMWA